MDFETKTPGTDVVKLEESNAEDVLTMPVLAQYDRFLVFFSGGKDSVACVLKLLELGVPRDRIELHHHLVDAAEGSKLMDWPVSRSYCEAFARAFGIAFTVSWREGGFEREMLREDSATAPCWVPAEGGGYIAIGGNGPRNTRLKFPQVSASLLTRWCSSSQKISCGDAYITNHAKFRTGKTCVVTGERAQESASRARYKVFEPHRADNRNGPRVSRWVDHWRPVHALSTKEVWALMQAWRVAPFPSYHFVGRASCMKCIFGSKNQWATVRVLDPEGFAKIAAYEQQFGVTIHRSLSVTELADRGTPVPMDPRHVEEALSTEFAGPIFVDDWKLPAGAYGESCGPT